MVWEVINLVAKIETQKQELDDPLGRKLGEYLWPEWFDAKHWYIYEPRPGDPNSPKQGRWDSMYQQMPRASTGNEWDDEFTQWYQPGEEPRYLMKFSASDYAVTDPKDSDDPDFTEHGIGGLDENGHLWLVDWYYGQSTTNYTIAALSTTNYTIAALIRLCKDHNVKNGFGETGIIRRAIESQFVTQQREAEYWLSIEYLPHIGDKIAKFAEAKAMGSAGKVHIPDTPWGRRLHNQLCAFPSPAEKDDGPDVLALFCRAAKDMVWSREKVTRPPRKGVQFGSWEWLTHNERNRPERSKWL
jgi:predicted phage terminase large subunit-like protein